MQRLSDFQPLLPAEEELIQEYRSGNRVSLGDGVLPDPELPELELRAEVIRLMMVGSDPDLKLHEKGLRIQGAWITGRLDLQGMDCDHDLTLSRCRFDKPPSFINARLRGLHLGGCDCPGLYADNARFEGSVFLRNGFVSTGEISMPNVQIAGDLQICDARIMNAGKTALFAVGMRVGASVYLGDYPLDDVDTDLIIDGTVTFASAHVDRDFYCKSVSFAAGEPVMAAGWGQSGSEGDHAIAWSLVRADIGGVLYAKDIHVARGIVNWSGARAYRLNDDCNGEGSSYPIRLDGFDYRNFSQHTDITVPVRLAWLDRRPKGIGFSAQPYEHLASILNQIGHRDDARRVLMEQEKLLRRNNLAAARAEPYSFVRVPVMWTINTLLGMLTGYGYRPSFAVMWAGLIICLLSLFYHKTWQAGDMAPNAAPVLISADWISATHSHPDNPGAFWSAPGQAGQDYETFHPVAYATDLLVPIVNLGQEQAWAPSTSRSAWGWHGWWLRWFAKLIGWVLTALGAAALTGAIRRN